MKLGGAPVGLKKKRWSPYHKHRGAFDLEQVVWPDY